MRWFRIRKAKIAPDLRQTLEQHGIGTMQTLLAAPDRLFVYRGQSASANQVRDDLLLWLTEQYDRAERKETWTLTMEAAIIVLIVVEKYPYSGIGVECNEQLASAMGLGHPRGSFSPRGRP